MKRHDNRGKTCSVPGCKNSARVKGLCNNCYQKKKIKERRLKK